MSLIPNIPSGPLADKWAKCRFDSKLVSPANRRKYEIIVVGTGLAGASAAATLAELGYNVKAFCIQDSPRRAHSIAAQGGINAAKNYQNDGDSVLRLFYDTIKGGDFRAARPTSIGWPQVTSITSLINVLPRASFRPRIRRPACQPLLWRRPGFADLLRPGPDRPAASARRLLAP